MSKDKEKKVKLTKEEKKAKKAEKKANKTGMDVNVKATIIRCVSAVICVAIVLVSVSSSVSKITKTNLEIASKGSESSDGFDEFGFDDFDDAGTTTDGGTVATDGSATATTDDGATVVTDGGTTDSTGGTQAATPNGGTQAAKPAAKTTAEILAIYNAATKKVEAAKVPFSKDRTTTEKKYEAGLALNTSKSIVYKFMGIGDANKFAKEVTKEDADSYFKYFKASSLSEADVTKVAIKENGGNYEIKIAVKDGSSSVKGGKVISSNNSPLDRSGVSCGDKDKDYWDHKTAANVYSAVSEIPACGSANIDETYSDAMIVAVVNVSTGNLVSLSAKFTFHFDLSNVMGSKGTAEAVSVINMKNFKW